ncbi:MAG: DUF4160 domain-containing protein [Chlorobium sp.]|nr:DUF4160 domain-containing protein [Chlorobium sp.]
MHVHCRNGDMECKYWLKRELFDIEEAFAYNMTERDNRQVRKIIYDHSEYIETQWDEFQRRRKQ